MYAVKLIEVGDDLAIIFPPEVLDILQAKEGDVLNVIEKNHGFELVKSDSIESDGI